MKPEGRIPGRTRQRFALSLSIALAIFGSSVAVPFWLASGLLLGLAPIFAWSGRHTNESPSGCAANGKLAFRRREAR